MGFYDPSHNTTYRYNDGGQLTVFREGDGYDAADIAECLHTGSHGLILDREGQLTSMNRVVNA